jgi:hypothetical protein
MYLRITRGRFDPARYNEVMGIVQDVVTALHRQPGFQTYYNGVDRTAGTIAAVSTWDTEEHARFDRAVLGDVVSRLQDLGVQLAAPEIYEVVGQA